MLSFSDLKINRFWLISAMIWLGVIIVLSFTSSERVLGTVSSVNHGEEIGHVACYAVLMFCFLMAFPRSVAVGWIGLICFVVGITIELIQSLTVYRGYQMIDIVSDLVGIVIGYLVFRWVKSRQTLHS